MKNRNRLLSATAPHVTHDVEGSQYGKHSGICTCFIIPQHVLERFAKDKKLTEEQKRYFVDAAKLEQDWRKTRASTATSTAFPNSHGCYSSRPSTGWSKTAK